MQEFINRLFVKYNENELDYDLDFLIWIERKNK